MRPDHVEIVCFALGFHLGIDSDAITVEHRLDEDLGLDPLDLVLVVLRLEELGDVEFPVADLEGLRTVRDLVDVVQRWCTECEEADETLPPGPLRTDSGFRLSISREDAAASSPRRQAGGRA
jgi:acyl carrier protein